MSASKKLRAKIESEQKRVEVRFISDEDVLNIITPYGIAHSQGNKRKSLRTQPKKTEQDVTLTTSITRSGRKIVSRILPSSIHKEVVNDSESEDEEDIVPEDNQKPSDLFEDNVAGTEVFGFKTPKKARAMLQKAVESTDVKRTPSKTDADRPPPPKTPHSFRDNLKKKIKKEVERLEENLFDWSGSEYEPEDSNSSDSSELSDDDFVPLATINKTTSPPPVLTSRPRNSKPDYVFTSDEFFASKSGRALTSNHTLNKLATPRMGQQVLHTLLNEYQPNHYSHITSMNEQNSTLFYRWLYTFKEGYNIVVYGLGSKRTLIEKFRQIHLSQSNVLVINGYFPGLTIKEMTESVLEAVSGSGRGGVTDGGLDAVLGKVKRRHRLFLLVHNIDGPMLRSDKAQQFLARLAHHPNIHLLASIDHINAPLLWDQKKLSNFKFIWEDGTSFLPYIEETRFESSIMVQSSGTLALAALKNVYKSLNSNSQNIFKLLLNHQLEAGKNKTGLQFSQLYRACREKFFVSSDLVLRTQLTEFIDHQLVRWKKESDTLSIPVELSVLQQFKSEVETEE